MLIGKLVLRRLSKGFAEHDLRFEDTYRKKGMSDFVDFCFRCRITRKKEKQNQKLGII